MNLIRVENEKKLLSPSLPSAFDCDVSREISGILISLNVSCALFLILDNIPVFSILDPDDNPLFTRSLLVGAPKFVNLNVGSDIIYYIYQTLFAWSIPFHSYGLYFRGGGCCDGCLDSPPALLLPSSGFLTIVFIAFSASKRLIVRSRSPFLSPLYPDAENK